jgi:DNA-binding protein YbaB
MSDRREDDLRDLVEDAAAHLSRARVAAQAGAGPGADSTGSVTVVLGADGRVGEVRVTAGWRRHLGPDELADAVVGAVQDAAVRRMDAWAEAYGSAPRISSSSSSAPRFGEPLQLPPADRLTPDDRVAALTALLELVESVERGIDEVSAQLPATVHATHTGWSPERDVSVTLTGGGEVTAVYLGRGWLRDASEVEIGRQLGAAFRAAYQRVDAHGVTRLIADSPLGEVQRLTQDPFGLAGRGRAR